ncbi:MAG: tetratricopeptide repeat protein, partial [Candidatus Thorarchaeota archaeon]
MYGKKRKQYDVELGDVMRVELIEREIMSWLVTDPKKYLKVGKRLHELGKDVYAIQYLKKGLTYDPESKDLHKTLGDAYINLENLREADAHYCKVVEIGPKCDKSWARLASICLKRGDVHRADVASAEALMLNRKDPFNWLVKANVFRRLGLTDHANTCYFLATDGRKKLGEAWAGLVTTYEDL